MDPVHKEVLQLCHKYLLDNIEVTPLLDELYSITLFHQDDWERIACLKTSSEKRRLFLRTLIYKGPSAWNDFLDALKNNDKDYVCEELRTRHMCCRICNHVKSEYTFLQGNVTVVNIGQFVTEKAQLTPDDKTTINSLLRRKFDNENVHILQDDDHKEDTIRIQNIGLRHVDQQDLALTMRLPIQQTKKMEDWTEEDVITWLRTIGIKENHIESIQSEEINGSVLCEMPKEDTAEAFPGVPYGPRFTIIKHRDQVIEAQKSQGGEKMETGRFNANNAVDGCTQGAQPFNALPKILPHGELEAQCGQPFNPSSHINMAQIKNSRRQLRLHKGIARGANFVNDEMERPKIIVASSDNALLDSTNYLSYQENNILGDLKLVPSSDFLQPFHALSSNDLSHKDSRDKFALDIVKFVCTCLNERRNGTIHFGITNTKKVQGTTLSDEKQEYEDFLQTTFVSSFYPDQLDDIRSCCSKLRFVPVENKENRGLYVVELDVTASYSVCLNDVFYVREYTAGERKSTCVIYRFIDGEVKRCDVVEKKKFIDIKDELADKRQKQEGNQDPYSHSRVSNRKFVQFRPI